MKRAPCLPKGYPSQPQQRSLKRQLHIASACTILLYVFQIVRRGTPKAPPDIMNCISKFPANEIAYLFCRPERNGYEAPPSYRIRPCDNLQHSCRSAEYSNYPIFGCVRCIGCSRNIQRKCLLSQAMKTRFCLSRIARNATGKRKALEKCLRFLEEPLLFRLQFRPIR